MKSIINISLIIARLCFKRFPNNGITYKAVPAINERNMTVSLFYGFLHYFLENILTIKSIFMEIMVVESNKIKITY